MWRKRAVAAPLVTVVALLLVIAIAERSNAGVPRRIAYVTGASASAPEVLIAASDGSHARRLGSGTDPLLAPNGAAVAAASTSSRGPALTIYSSSGSVTRRFFDIADATAHAQAWSPDSRYLAVMLSSTDPASDAASGLAVIDAKSGTARVIAHGPIYGASFAPGGSDKLVYASAASNAVRARVNLYVAAADGAGKVQMTHDGRSLNPVWGRRAIAFDHERLRRDAAPAYQVWLMSPGGTLRQLTGLPVAPLMQGLVPLSFSQDGTRLLAEYEGLDTSQAWTITLSGGLAVRLEVGGHGVSGAAISQSGATVLIDQGGFLNPPNAGKVASLPFSGGAPKLLITSGSDPSWNL